MTHELPPELPRKQPLEQLEVTNELYSAIDELKQRLKFLRFSTNHLDLERTDAEQADESAEVSEIASQQMRWGIQDAVAALQTLDHSGADDKTLLIGSIGLESYTRNLYGPKIDSEATIELFDDMRAGVPVLYLGDIAARYVLRDPVIDVVIKNGRVTSELVVPTVAVTANGELDLTNPQTLRAWIGTVGRDFVLGKESIQAQLNAQTFRSWEVANGAGLDRATNGRSIENYAELCRRYNAAGQDLDAWSIERASLELSAFKQRQVEG